MQSSSAAPHRYHTLSEILSQASIWQHALDVLHAQQDTLGSLFTRYQPQQLLFVGCGSPYYLARTAASAARAWVGIPAEAHPASDIWLFGEQALTLGQRSLMVVISRSGETTEVLKAIEQYKRQNGGPVVAITCYPESNLASLADATLAVPEAQETGLAQTRSFTSMLVLVLGMLQAFAGLAPLQTLHPLPASGQRLLDTHTHAMRDLGRTMTYQRVFFLGSGVLYGLACEAMLKMKEMSLSNSEAFHFLEFRHGPMSMIDEQALVVGLVSKTGLTYETAVLTEMRQKGAGVLAITPAALPEHSANTQIVLPGGFSDLERGPLYLPLLHLMIYEFTLRKGLDPDRPRNLSAVINLDGEHPYQPQTTQ
jgi:glucosamine--fructose-6-phosphate aminotransferase (isomerizing)